MQAIADKMCRHLFIERPIKVLTRNGVAAGSFDMIDDLVCIWINGDTVTQTFEQKIAILAHEMSHYYLIKNHGIALDDERENELLTDINAVYVGFGFLLLEGYKPREHIFDQTLAGHTVKTTKVGYIDSCDIVNAIIQTAKARKQKPHWVVRNIGFPANIGALCRLYPLFKEYYKAKKR